MLILVALVDSGVNYLHLCSIDIKYFNDNTPDKYHLYFKALSVPPTLLVELGRIVSTKFCLLKQIVCAN